MSFAEDMAKVCQRAGDKVDLLVRKAAIDIGKGLVESSPVDTGRFKNNWNYGNDAINRAASWEAGKDGSSSINRIVQGANAWQPGQTIYITNSLPYAKRLEDGWSKQAPAGMVKITVANFQSAIREAAAQL